MTTNSFANDVLPYAHQTQGTSLMLLEEDLARTRMRDSETFAEHQRLAHRLVVANRWRRLSGWAQQRAARSARAL